MRRAAKETKLSNGRAREMETERNEGGWADIKFYLIYFACFYDEQQEENAPSVWRTRVHQNESDLINFAFYGGSCALLLYRAQADGRETSFCMSNVGDQL